MRNFNNMDLTARALITVVYCKYASGVIYLFLALGMVVDKEDVQTALVELMTNET